MQTQILAEILFTSFVKLDKNSKICFYCTIFIFDLTVGLKIKDSKYLAINSKKIAE